MTERFSPYSDVSIHTGSSQSIGPSTYGNLFALRTKAEVDAQCELAEAFVVEVPANYTAVVLRSIDGATDQKGRTQLSHLRRVIRWELLPPSLRCHKIKDADDGRYLASTATPPEQTTLDPSASASLAADATSRAPEPLSLHVLLCPTNIIARDRLLSLLSASGPFSENELVLRLSTVKIPLKGPISEQEAQQWSRAYWPAVYKKYNPLGPQPAMVERAAKEIGGQVEMYMRLARQAGHAALDASIGEEIGAVIVDRTNTHDPSILALAGDGRWKGVENNKRHGGGNVMAHAVMRVIGMVARKRRACSDSQQIWESDDQNQEVFAETTLTPLERQVYLQSSVTPGGYLCLDLEVYITHEPCVMCCMALLHSRFGRVVFGIQMDRTGGLVAERTTSGESQGPAYGLFWRPSFNWKFLAWQWLERDNSNSTAADKAIHA